METILSKIIDTEKLSNYVKSSLGDLDKLRKVSNALRNNPSLCSVLEDELIDRLDEFYTKSTQKDHGQCQEYLHWVCCIIDRLSVKKWSNRSETLWAAVCDVDMGCGPSLLKLALQSNVVTQSDLLNRINELPSTALIHGMQAVQDKDMLLSAATKILDDTTLIKLLIALQCVKASYVDWALSCNDVAKRLSVALKALHVSDDANLKRSSLTLLRQILSKCGVECGELIVNMLSVAEQKQVHLIEPVLMQFVETTRDSSTSDVFWTLCVFQRLFYHQTSWVRMTSLRYFLGLHNFHRRVFTNHGEHFYAESFLDAIDQLSLYARTETCPLAGPSLVGSSLRDWLQGLEENIHKKQFSSFVACLLHNVCARSSWNSVSLLYISEAIVSLGSVTLLESLQPIQTALNIWSFQEPLVRGYIIRLWLHIACKFSSEDVKVKQLCQLASQFLEDAGCIREHLIPLEVEPFSPIGLCILAWKQSDCAEEILNLNADNPQLWLQLSKVRTVPSVWKALKKAIEIDKVQIAGIALLKSSATRENEKNAIVEVLGKTRLKRDVLNDAINAHLDWRLFYLWSKMGSEDSPICAKCFSEVAQISDWADMFAKPSITYMIRTLSNISVLQSSQKHAAETLELACQLLPLTPQPMVSDLLRLIKAYLGAADSRETLSRILNMSWVSCLETRKATSMFSECVNVFMKILFDRSVFLFAFDDLLEICVMVREYVDSVPWFGEMFYLTMIGFLRENKQCIGIMCDQVALGLCYGPIFRKDQKVILDTERYVLNKLTSTYMPDSTNLKTLTECEAAINVRAKCVSFIRTIEPDDAWKLIKALQSHDNAVSSTRKRYFNNSTIHRVKTRAWQAILVLLDTAKSGPMLDAFLIYVLEQLKNGLHQMTVRILMEWCTVKVILRGQFDVIDLMSSATDKASAERMGSICSYLNILMHVCCAIPDCQLITRSAPLVMPWMMAQHFAVRLHAQFVFRRIVSLCRCESQKCHAVYRPQLEALQRVVNYGGGAKNATKLDSDFYMSECVLPECETYDLVFDKIPKSYGLADVDCVPSALFEGDSSWARDSGREVNTELKIELVDENCSRPDVTTAIHEANYQRKIVPERI
ncbi:uncharacterized protein LOC111266269 isoform X2 [Varroa jacobsoni]|uniref:uncharacterized protein LOC111266269 isoform X2 n=1 Tax=Varroa jacobsoni TaxID=62625 RepID=UPI000BF57899|nr:uncharacterized protein LOC111266269 isoform X2 [Varroa jacobsoni]